MGMMFLQGDDLGDWMKQVSKEWHIRNASLDLFAALQSVEWGCEVDAAEGGFVAGCPSCGAEKRTGAHHEGCQLHAALLKAEART